MHDIIAISEEGAVYLRAHHEVPCVGGVAEILCQPQTSTTRRALGRMHCLSEGLREPRA